MQTLLGILVGGVITWFASWYFYVRSAKDLEQEAAGLRRVSNMLLVSMEHAGWIRLNRDNAGRITGFEQVISPASATVRMEGLTPTVRQQPPEGRR
jgi:hypothetical protein